MNANGGIETMNEMTKTIIIVIIIVYSPQNGVHGMLPFGFHSRRARSALQDSRTAW